MQVQSLRLRLHTFHVVIKYSDMPLVAPFNAVVKYWSSILKCKRVNLYGF